MKNILWQALCSIQMKFCSIWYSMRFNRIYCKTTYSVCVNFNREFCNRYVYLLCVAKIFCFRICLSLYLLQFFWKIITITRMDYMTFYSSNFTVFIPTSSLLKLSSSISNIDAYRKIYYLLCSIISLFLPIILLCIANTISTCILVEVSFYISTVWLVPLLVDQWVPEGTCSQILRTSSVDS